MNNWINSYIWGSAIQQIFYLFMAVITPVYFTVGLYYWTVFFILLWVLSGFQLGDKLMLRREVGYE